MNYDMPEFRDPAGQIFVWDPTSHTYVIKQDAFPVPDRGHATGGDNDLFSPNQLEHSELPGVPELEGHMASTQIEKKIQEVAERFHDTASPDYGNVFWNPKTKSVFWCYADYTDGNDIQPALDAFAQIDGVEHVDGDAESYPDGYEYDKPGDWKKLSAAREFADPGQVLCPQCRESTDQPVCPLCNKDLTPEWNQFKHKHPGEDFLNQQADHDVASEFTSWPDRVPKPNRLNTDNSFPSMISNLQWVAKLASRKISQDEWDLLENENLPVEIGKWIQDRSGQLHFDHGVHGVHEDLAARQGLRWPEDIGALGSVYNNGLADTQRVFPGHPYDHPSVQQQIGQAFGPAVTLNPPVNHQGVVGKGEIFSPFEVKGGIWLIHPHPGQSFITGAAWVRERPGAEPFNPNMILCAEHLQPEDYALYANGVKAIITATGGLTSHAAMLASTQGIPVVVGLGTEYNKLESGNYLRIDPVSQTILVTPGMSSNQDPNLRRQIGEQVYQYLRQNDPYVQGVRSSLNPKPEYFSHILEEEAWHLANDASLDDCPECHSPMVDKSGEKVCHSCGHKQPILHMGMTKEGLSWGDLNPLSIPGDAVKGVGEGMNALGVPGGSAVEGYGNSLNWLPDEAAKYAPAVGDWAIHHPEAAGLAAGGAALMATGVGAPEGAALEGAAAADAGLAATEGAGAGAAAEGAGAGIGSRLLGLGGQGLKGLGVSDLVHGIGGAMNGAMGGGQQGYGQPTQNVSLPGTISKVAAGTFGDEEEGTATKNRGENSDPEIGSSPEKKEIGDSPEQLKDVGGGPVGHDDQSGHNLHGGDPALQEKALKAFELNKPLVIEFMNSDESGADHPIIQALDQLLETAFPGYKGMGPNQPQEEPVVEVEDSHEDKDEDAEKKDDATEKKDLAKAASVWHYAYDDFQAPLGPTGETPYGETGDWEEPQENPECPMCGGPGVLLGSLGRREHFRCRNCGMDFSHETTPVQHGGQPVNELSEPGFNAETELQKGPAYYASKKMAVGTMPAQPVPPGGVQMHGQPFPVCPKCGYPHDPSMPCAADQSNPAGTPGAAVNPAPYAVGMQGITPPIPQKVVTHIEDDDFGDWTAARGEGTWRADESDEPEEDEKEVEHEFDVETEKERDEKAHSGHVQFHDPDEQFDEHIAAAMDRYAGDWDHEKEIQQTPGEHHHEHDSDDWTDDSGQPLQEGAEYEMHTAGSDIPDRVTILASNPHKVTFMLHSGDVDYQHQLDRKQAELDGTTFTAASDGVDSESGSDMGDIPPVRPGQDPTPQVDDLSTPSTHASSTEQFTGSFERAVQPLGEYVGSFRGDNPDDRNWLMSGGSSAVEVDPTLMEKFAGKDFSAREQREFINEGDNGPGARNLDRLQIEDTHYIDEDLHLTDSLW